MRRLAQMGGRLSKIEFGLQLARDPQSSRAQDLIATDSPSDIPVGMMRRARRRLSDCDTHDVVALRMFPQFPHKKRNQVGVGFLLLRGHTFLRKT
jgi:hypothetical protein